MYVYITNKTGEHSLEFDIMNMQWVGIYHQLQYLQRNMYQCQGPLFKSNLTVLTLTLAAEAGGKEAEWQAQALFKL